MGVDRRMWTRPSLARRVRVVFAVCWCVVGGLDVASFSPRARAAEDPVPPRAFRAGASVVDVTPPTLPVRQNGGFLEATASRVIDPLAARALVLDDGERRIAFVVVDSCMLPRTVCDAARALISESAGLRPDRILISATHTHSAPSSMDYCLGSRADPSYVEWLPGRLAEAIHAAVGNLERAEIGYTVAQAPEHTNCRRWILRSDRVGTDPFGQRTVRAMMHSGLPESELRRAVGTG